MDLDDEELKATRKLNGSNKNVGSMEKDINKLIEELTNVRPNELSTDGLKLFNKINEIIDINKELKEKFIPVSLVEEKMEEVNKEDENLMYKNNIIKILQELLEKRK